MRRLRVCIYGGTDLQPPRPNRRLQGASPGFISDLAYEILDSMSAVIVTGGFRHRGDKPSAISADFAALRGARRYALEKGVRLEDCYEGWVPEPGPDGHPDIEGVFRMTEADGITVRVIAGRTPLGRRLAMVAGADMVVAFAGENMQVVVEQALELGIPVLLMPDPAGESKDLFEQYKQRIAASFDHGTLETCLGRVSETISSRPDMAAKAVVELLNTAKVGKCLVLLPFDDEHNSLYSSTIEPAVSAHMVSVRLDRLANSEAIYASFADAILSASAVVADITRLNENVMYEVGYGHGRGLTPLLYTREASRLEQLPVYFRTLNVRLASEMTPVDLLIAEYLRATKSAHTVSAPPPG